MTLVLELSSEIEQALRQEAARLRTTPELLAVQALRNRFDALPNIREGQAAYDALKPFIGTLHSGKGDLSQNTGARFTAIVAERRRTKRNRD